MWHIRVHSEILLPLGPGRILGISTWYTTYSDGDIIICQYESTVRASQLVYGCHV